MPEKQISKSTNIIPNLMKSAKAWPSIEGCGWMLMLKAEGLKLYSQRVSMNGRWRVSVT